MHVHFVIHELFEGPAAVLDWATASKYPVGFSRVYAGESLPASVDEIDLLVVMGGPQSPGTSRKECSYFDAVAEKHLIQQCITAHKAVLGICLGAQLAGEALGAPYEHSPEKEIGIFPISLTEEGLRNDKFAHFGQTAETGHWHGDMPGLTTDCRIIASSEGCPRQIVEYTPLVYGFQCHLEFTSGSVALLIKHAGEEIRQSARYKFVQQPEAMLHHPYGPMNRMLFTFLDKLAEAYQKQAPQPVKIPDNKDSCQTDRVSVRKSGTRKAGA